MVIDCHTHIWAVTERTSPDETDLLARQSRGRTISALPGDHAQAVKCVDKALVMGPAGAADLAGANEYVAQHVGRYPKTMIGVAMANPLHDDALEATGRLLDRPQFQAVAISPSTQGFHPTHSRAMRLYELVQRRQVPLLVVQGMHFPRQGRMEFARPSLLDEVAMAFGTLTMVVSSLGWPWIDEGLALIAKHPRVFADVAAMAGRPWQAYNALSSAHQLNVMDKILFGSNFPFNTPAGAIEGLYRLHELTQGTNLPIVPREMIRSIVERDAVKLLRLELSESASPQSASRAAVQAEN